MTFNKTLCDLADEYFEQAQVLAGKDDAGDDAFQLDMQDLETFGRERYGGGAVAHDATSTVREVP